MSNENKKEQVSKDTTDQERREALKKIGRFGAYTAPAMLTMLSSKASAIPMSMVDV
ncbi:MAG: hypothetical protein ABW140_07350 [Candidatus Sedimenticola sp. 6PFRAG1]